MLVRLLLMLWKPYDDVTATGDGANLPVTPVFRSLWKASTQSGLSLGLRKAMSMSCQVFFHVILFNIPGA